MIKRNLCLKKLGKLYNPTICEHCQKGCNLLKIRSKTKDKVRGDVVVINAANRIGERSSTSSWSSMYLLCSNPFLKLWIQHFYIPFSCITTKVSAVACFYSCVWRVLRRDSSDQGDTYTSLDSPYLQSNSPYPMLLGKGDEPFQVVSFYYAKLNLRTWPSRRIQH